MDYDFDVAKIHWRMTPKDRGFAVNEFLNFGKEHSIEITLSNFSPRRPARSTHGCCGMQEETATPTSARGSAPSGDAGTDGTTDGDTYGDLGRRPGATDLAYNRRDFYFD